MNAEQRKLDCVPFKKELREKYFVVAGQRATCTTCNENISALKDFNLRRHYKTKHISTYLKFAGNLHPNKFEFMKYNLKSQLPVSIMADKSIILASYEIVHHMAQRGVPFTDGNLIKQSIMTAVKYLCPEKIDLFDRVCLSATSVMRRTRDLANNFALQICEQTSNCLWFSLALDEFTDISNTSRLLVFIRGINLDFRITAELASVCDMSTTTSGADIFKEIEKILDNLNLQWNQLRCVTIDGGRNMARIKQDLALQIKSKLGNLQLPDVLFINCILHQQAFCVYDLDMSCVLDPVINMINLLRTNPPNYDHFRNFLDEVDTEFGGLPYYYSELSWFSCWKVLSQFYDLRREIEHQFQVRRFDTPLNDPVWQLKLAFLVDVTFHVNELNLRLQNKDNLICDLYKIIKEFRVKLSLMNTQLEGRNFSQFDCFRDEMRLEKHVNMQFQYLMIRDLNQLFSERFSELDKIENDINLFQDPFNSNIVEVPAKLQLELIDLQASNLLKNQYKQGNLVEFYRCLPNEDFSELKKFASVMVSMFGTTHLCQQIFLKMRYVKLTHRTSLDNENLKAILLIGGSNFKANIENIVTR